MTHPAREPFPLHLFCQSIGIFDDVQWHAFRESPNASYWLLIRQPEVRQPDAIEGFPPIRLQAMKSPLWSRF